MPGLSAPQIGLDAQVAAGFRAAWLLGQGREEGLAFAMLSPEGAARSFWAGLICFLPFLLIRAITGDALLSPDLPVQLIGYVLGWVVFPLAALQLAEALGRGANWPLFIAAWNWTNLVQYGALLLATLLGGILPQGFGGLLVLVAFGYALWMEWFVARAALRVSGARAAAFVLADMGISLFIASVVARLSGG